MKKLAAAAAIIILIPLATGLLSGCGNTGSSEGEKGTMGIEWNDSFLDNNVPEKYETATFAMG